jgi:adenylate cyclase
VVLLSAVVDVAVLMVAIWSFHLQYGVSPAVYLKAPTLLYVFILIAVRALRLEAAPVVAAGLAAVIGWAALFGYALAEAGPDAVTRDWAVYMTSASILVGAEVDKLLAIAAVTAILAVAVTRARRLMLREAAERRATEDLSRFFAPGVAETIRAAELDFTRPGARREATVLMTDLEGFSALSARMSAEETLALLAEYHARVVPVIHRHGGAIDKYLGDGILATFGAVRPDGGHGRSGLAALAEILRAGEAWAAERAAAGRPAAPVRGAMDSGPVTLGVVGVDGRYEFTIIGDVVNRVAKLDKLGGRLGAAAVVTARAFEAGGAAGEGLSVRRVREAAPELGGTTDLVAIERPGAARLG